MKDLALSIFIVISVILLCLLYRGLLAESLLLKLERTGEIKLYDEVYTCKLKGTWKSENIFVPAEVKE